MSRPNRRLLSALALGLSLTPATAAAPDRPLPPASPVPAGEQPFEFRLDGMTATLRFDADVPSPEAFLGYAVGEHFTRHHDTVAYARAIYTPYGLTNQRRELGILTVSSPANLARLGEILETNRRLADPRATDEARRRDIAGSNPAVIWLSFNVHGNEASCTEVAPQLAYTLAAATNPEVVAMLDRVVVVIDPCLNPDGRSRYVHWFEQTVGATPNAEPAAREHSEPWPSGRANHYLFDLN